MMAALGLGALCIAAAMCVLIWRALNAPTAYQDPVRGLVLGIQPMPAPGRDDGASPCAVVTSVSPAAHEVTNG